MAELLINPRFREFDSNGDPLSGGKLYSYIAGTVTPLSTFSDHDAVTPNANPVVLDANGAANIWISSAYSYKFILTDADDVVQWTVDNVSTSGSSSEGSGPWTEHAITDGQAATDLAGETLDLDEYSSAIYNVEIIRGTSVISNGVMAIQSLNGVGRVVLGLFMAEEPHGVTFSVTQSLTVVQLKAALDSGAGNGTIKLSRRLIAV